MKKILTLAVCLMLVATAAVAMAAKPAKLPKVTGGGQIPVVDAAGNVGTATFGFNAQALQLKSGTTDEYDAKGQLQYVDHLTGMVFHGKITRLIYKSDKKYVIRGELTDGTKFKAVAVDNGEPGVNDKFKLLIPPSGSAYDSGGF